MKTIISFLALLPIVLLGCSNKCFSQNVDATWGPNLFSAWYTGTNWVGNLYPGVQGVATSNFNIATFTGAFLGNTAGINMKTNSLNLGSIYIDNTRNTSTSVGNSSSQAAGVLRLYGAIINGIPNTIIRNNGSSILTLQSVLSGNMGLVLGNATNNIVNLDGTGSIIISSLISGTAGPLTFAGTGAGGRIDITGSNTFSNATNQVQLTGPEVRFSADASFGTLPASVVANHIIINGGGLSILSGSSLTLNPNRGIQVSSNPNNAIIIPGNTGALTYSGIIGDLPSNSGVFTKSGPGKLVLTGSNTYTGLTAISEGTLQLKNAGGMTIPAANNVTISGGTLQVSFNHALNNITLSPGGTLLIDNGITLIINGTFDQNGGTITLTGTGKIVYGPLGVLSYGGSTSQTATVFEWPVAGGPAGITINNSVGVSMGSLARTINGTLNMNSGTLNINGQTLLLNGPVVGSGTLSGSSNTNLTIGGATGTLNFTPGSSALNNLIINSSGIATLGTSLDIYGTIDLETSPGGILDLNGRNLSLKSSAVSTARLSKLYPANSSHLNNATNVTAERYIPAKRAWRLLSVPTSGQTFNASWQEGQPPGSTSPTGYGTQISSRLGAVNGFDYPSHGDALLSYNTGNNAWDPVSGTNISMATAGGYLLYVRGDRTIVPNTNTNSTPTILRSTGTIYMGDQPAITVPSGQFGLIGNVFTSAIDFSTINKTVDDGFWVWDPKLNISGGYVAFVSDGNGAYTTSTTGGSYPAPPYKNIESGQAFFVYRTNTGSGTITLQESNKTSGNREVQSPQGGIGEQIRINLYGLPGAANYLVDGTLTIYDDSFSNAVDQYDARKIPNFNENLSVVRDGISLSIEKRKPVGETDTIFLHMTSLKKQEYRLEFITHEMDHPGYYGHLEDNYLNTRTPIVMNGITDLHFSIDANPASARPDRFHILFSKTMSKPSSTGIRTFPNPVTGRNISLQFTDMPAGVYDLKLINTIGQTILNNSLIHSGGTRVHKIQMDSSLSTGIYCLEIEGSNKLLFYSKIIK